MVPLQCLGTTAHPCLGQGQGLVWGPGAGSHPGTCGQTACIAAQTDSRDEERRSAGSCEWQQEGRPKPVCAKQPSVALSA